MKSLVLSVVLLLAGCGPCWGGLLLFDFKRTAGGSAQGTVDTIANTFTLTSFTRDVATTQVPNMPLVFQGRTANSLDFTLWDVPDNATHAQVLTLINSGPHGFVVTPTISQTTGIWTIPITGFGSTNGNTAWGLTPTGLDSAADTFAATGGDGNAQLFSSFGNTLGGTSSIFWTTVTPTVVPEQSSLLLTALAGCVAIGYRLRRRLLPLAIVLVMFSQSQAGFITVDMSSTLGPQRIIGTVDTVANTFTINTFIPPTTPVNVGVPATFPLVLQAYQSPANIKSAWDVPDNADFATIKLALDTERKFFALAGTNASYTWTNGATGTTGAEGGWGGGFSDPNNVFNARQFTDGSSLDFRRWAASTFSTGTNFSFTTIEEVIAVPEPSTMLLFGSMAAVMGSAAYRRRRQLVV